MFEGDAPAVADDPMSALDEVEENESPTKNEIRSKTLVQYCLPDRDAPTTARDGRDRSCGPSQSKCLGKSTNQVWIAVEDVEWLINYVATEVALGGVPQVEAAAVAEGNCEVEGLRVQWNFGAQSWRAEFVTGKLQGTIVHSSVSKMNAENGLPCLPQLRWNLRRRVSNS